MKKIVLLVIVLGYCLSLTWGENPSKEQTTAGCLSVSSELIDKTKQTMEVIKYDLFLLPPTITPPSVHSFRNFIRNIITLRQVDVMWKFLLRTSFIPIENGLCSTTKNLPRSIDYYVYFLEKIII